MPMPIDINSYPSPDDGVNGVRDYDGKLLIFHTPIEFTIIIFETITTICHSSASKASINNALIFASTLGCSTPL